MTDWSNSIKLNSERFGDGSTCVKNGDGYACCILLVVGLSGCGHVDEVTPRSYVGLLIGDTAALRDQVAQALSAGKPAPNAGVLTLKPQKDGVSVVPVDFGWTTASGSIVAHNKKYGVIVVQEPIVSKGGVKWECVVYPSDATPNMCGSP